MMGRFDFSHYYLNLVLFGLCLLIGIVLVYRLQRENAEEAGEVTNADRIEEFEQAYYAGDLNREEFERIRLDLLRKAPADPWLESKKKPAIPLGETDDSL